MNLKVIEDNSLPGLMAFRNKSEQLLLKERKDIDPQLIESMKESLKRLPDDLLTPYCQQVSQNLNILFEDLTDADISTDAFSFYTSVSSVFSSKMVYSIGKAVLSTPSIVLQEY